MTPKEKILDTCMRVISEMQSETAALVIGRILDLERECMNLIKSAEDRGTRQFIAESDRDNRRRRMDIAKVILDETQVCDLDRIAEIIWPEDRSKVVLNAMYGKFAQDKQTLDMNYVSCIRCGGPVETAMGDLCDGCASIPKPTGEPVASDPTQVPTQETCGYKEQLGSRLWKCTRPKGHSDHHHLDDGHDLSSVSRPDYCTPNGVRTDGHLPKPGDKFVSWDCITMGHKWGDVENDGHGHGWRTCLACKDSRTL